MCRAINVVSYTPIFINCGFCIPTWPLAISKLWSTLNLVCRDFFLTLYEAIEPSLRLEILVEKIFRRHHVHVPQPKHLEFCSRLQLWKRWEDVYVSTFGSHVPSFTRATASSITLPLRLPFCVGSLGMDWCPNYHCVFSIVILCISLCYITAIVWPPTVYCVVEWLWSWWLIWSYAFPHSSWYICRFPSTGGIQTHPNSNWHNYQLWCFHKDVHSQVY